MSVTVPIALCVLLAAQDSRVDRQAESRAGSVAGVVLTVVGDVPVPSASVTLSSAGATRTVITGLDGYFMFTNVRAGRYSIVAKRAGYVPSTQESRTTAAVSREVVVEDGGHIDRLEMRLQKGAVISGTVRGLDGQPASGVRVNIEGRTESARTDSDGAFRIWGLPPGGYKVSASPRLGLIPAERLVVTPDDEVDRVLGELARMSRTGTLSDATWPAVTTTQAASREVAGGFAKVFYPGTIDASAAVTVDVAAGQEVGGVDFSLALAGVSEISGVVYDETGPVTGVLVSAEPRDRAFGGSRASASTDLDGKFRFRGVLTGIQYHVVARYAGRHTADAPVAEPARRPEITKWAAVDVVTTPQGESGIVLTLRHALRLTGRVMLDGADRSGVDTIQLRLTEWESRDKTEVVTRLPVARVISLNGVIPGRYHLAVSVPAVSGWHVSSIMWGPQDLLVDPLDVSEVDTPNGGLVITLTNRHNELSGTIRGGSDGDVQQLCVVVGPIEPERWHSRSSKLLKVSAATDRSYMIRDLPVGQYVVTAVPASIADSGELVTPAIQAAVRARGRTVTIRNGDRTRLDLDFVQR